MKKFLLILHCLLSGGAINSVVTLAEVLQKMGYNLTVVSKNDGFVREKFEAMGIEVIIQEDLVGEQFLQHVKKDYDHILVNTLLLFSVVEKLKNSKVKVHWWIHEPPLYFQSLGEQVCKSFWNDLSDNVTVYAAGHLILDWVRREYDYKCCLLNFGIEDCARVIQKQEVFELSSDKITFLIPSVFIQYIKGQDLMVKAIRGLSEEYINRAEFLFLGNNMDDEDFYHLVSSEIEQESSIKLIPAVEKESLFRLMRAADCIVAPSRQDATNACIVEGLMLSKICLCSDGTGVSHYMEDCVNGFIFSSGSVEELQARIMLIIDNFERLNVIAQNGRKIYEKIFSMKVFEENVSQYWKNGGEKMVVDLQVPVWTVKESVRYTMRTEKDELFPILDIDKDSYIVAAKVESGINWYWEAGIYNLQVGKFSSVAEDVLFMIDCNHDYRSVFQGCVSAIRDGNNQIQKLKRKGQIIIQNDCWIGHGATIMGGVTIHNGAVVAANSTVTKDVPAYAIVGGNPAKIIGYRFESEIIEKLLQIAWWDWTDEQIAENEELLRGDVSQFVNIFEKQTKYDLIENPVTRMQKGKLFVFYLDMSERFSLWEKVVDEFVKKFQGTDNELLLYFSPLELSDMSYSEKLLEKLEIYNDYDCYINIYSEIMEDDTILLKDADYYITNRLPGNIKRMCAAEQFGVTCISGVDSKIF